MVWRKSAETARPAASSRTHTLQCPLSTQFVMRKFTHRPRTLRPNILTQCPLSTQFLPFPVMTADAASCQSAIRPSSSRSNPWKPRTVHIWPFRSPQTG